MAGTYGPEQTAIYHFLADQPLPRDATAYGNNTGTFTADLTHLAGRELLRISFEFDSVNGQDNDFEGWFIDDVQLQRITIPRQQDLL